MKIFKDLEHKINLTLLRHFIQVSFGLFLLYVARQFYLFVQYYETGGGTSFVQKPGAVEGFLPVSSLMSFKLLITEGMFDPYHPAGLVIFIAILAVSLLFKKGFCSWICPIGTISEGIGKLGKKIFGRNFTLPRFLDYPLMSLKYLVLAFFVKLIVLDMPSFAIIYFLKGEYNIIADVKMLKFFMHPSATTLIVLGLLLLFSLLVKHFWCRYLCPYGALLGILSLLSPWKITRDPEKCIDCQLCTKACPSRIKVAESSTVYAPECTGCLDCLQACPKKGALGLKLFGKYVALKPILFPVLLLGLWFAIIGFAKVSGYWESAVSQEILKQLIPQADIYSH